eukprot:Partr_v1_DN26879_c0_g1_i6_m41020 putative Phosphatidylinositol glycan anchor biosynthesis, class P
MNSENLTRFLGSRSSSGSHDHNELYSDIQASGCGGGGGAKSSSESPHTSTRLSYSDELPRTPTYEFYGFVLYLLSIVFYSSFSYLVHSGFLLELPVVFLMWAYLPDYILHKIGISYYASKYWALALPSYALLTIVYIILMTWSLDFSFNPEFGSAFNVTDEVAVLTRRNSLSLHGHHLLASKDFGDKARVDVMPELSDIPLSVVNAILYEE